MGTHDADDRARAFKLAWQKRQEEWARFHQWEESCPEARPHWDLAARIKWYASAWELARQFYPSWADGSINWDKIERIKRWRAVMARLRGQKSIDGA